MLRAPALADDEGRRAVLRGASVRVWLRVRVRVWLRVWLRVRVRVWLRVWLRVRVRVRARSLECTPKP